MINLKAKFSVNKALLIAICIVTTLLIIAGGAIGYVYAYQGKFFAGVSVGTMYVGGITEDNGRSKINKRVDKLFIEGTVIDINGTTKTIPLRVEAPDDPDLSRDLVILNVDEALEKAYSIGRNGSFFQRGYDIATALITRPNIVIEVSTNQKTIENQLLENFGEYYNPAKEPTFNIKKIEDNWTVAVAKGSAGSAFDLEEASVKLIESLASLSMKPLRINVIDQEPSLTTGDIESMVDEALTALNATPYTLIYDGGRFDKYELELNAGELAQMLAVKKVDDTLSLAINENSKQLTDTLSTDINTEAKNAKFEISGKRVQEFQPSQEGRSVNVNETLKNIVAIISNIDANINDNKEESKEKDAQNSIDIVVDIVEPTVPTGSVNDLGISEILGVGQSTFAGSPANRMKNIRHGMSKLNGALIAPGEEFSLIKELGPFTIADGYVPELVIKGDEIIPEIAGGLCQIGSTTFRAVMNSGLKVTQRRNHSLVVGYYNDLSNGNPGTDATIYDPNPDFRFVNDTENYILFVTDMDVETGIMSFTFWGTNDGRKGYYTPPVVHNWISAGPTRTTYTTELAPGVRKCQGAHPGANTSFTYIVERPGQEPEETVYKSSYRALPRICLVGLAEGESVGENGELIEAPPAEPEPELVADETLVEEPDTTTP